MKLNNNERKVSVSGFKNKEKQFQIKSSPIAFKILSEGLYENKPLTIIRELSCNAYDAHVEAGTTDKEIEVHLPTTFEPKFYIKDYGTGLSHDDVLNLYTTYFESTKNNTNDQIGAFGLGSKSPFAYTESFNIESRFDGTRRLYEAYIDKKGFPSVLLLTEEEDTNEYNGLTISFPVKEQDIYDFKEAATEFYRFAEGEFKFTGQRIYIKKVDYFLEGDGYKLYRLENRYLSREIKAVQGGVVYPVKDSMIPRGGGWSDALRGVGALVWFDIGDIEVTVSREAISYTDETKQAIKEKLDSITKDFESKLQKKAKGIKTKKEMYKFMASLPDGLSNISLEFNGETIPRKYKLTKTPGKVKSYKVGSGYKNKQWRNIYYFRIVNAIRSNYPVVFVKTGKYRHLTKILTHNVGNIIPNRNKIVVYRDLEEEDKKFISSILDTYEFSSLDKPKSVSSGRSYKIKAKKFLINNKGMPCGTKNVEVDFKSNDGFYIPTYRGKFNNKCYDNEEWSFSDKPESLARDLVNLGAWDKEFVEKLIIVPASISRKVEGDTGWKSVSTRIVKDIKNVIDMDSWVRWNAFQNLTYYEQRHINSSLWRKIDALKEQVDPEGFTKKSMTYPSCTNTIRSFGIFPNMADIPKFEKKYRKVVENWEQLEKDNPIVSCFHSNPNSEQRKIISKFLKKVGIKFNS